MVSLQHSIFLTLLRRLKPNQQKDNRNISNSNNRSSLEFQPVIQNTSELDLVVLFAFSKNYF